MNTHIQPKGQKEGAAQKATRLLSYGSAIGFTFFGTGPAFQASQDYIREYVSLTYSDNLETASLVFWFALLALIIFTVSTIIIQLIVDIFRSRSFLKFTR